MLHGLCINNCDIDYVLIVRYLYWVCIYESGLGYVLKVAIMMNLCIEELLLWCVSDDVDIGLSFSFWIYE